MPTRIIDLPGIGPRRFVDREQLRFKLHGRMFRYPELRGVLDSFRAPSPPASWDWSQGEKLNFPIDGNDQYGDCYYAAVAHGSQCFTGNSGTECTFNVSQLTQRYLKLSGGDNGLDDTLIMPEWKSGIVGPNGPRKILDEMTVSMSDAAAQQAACWGFGGLIWTCSLLNTWLNNVGPGVIWDANGSPDPSAGHAMFLTGRHSNGNWDTRTWGISPPIQVTPAGMKAADSELIVVYSADHFNPSTGLCAFTGLTWEAKRAWWKQMGGKDVGPSPFPAPTPPVPTPPTPTPPGPTPTPPLPSGSFNLQISADCTPPHTVNAASFSMTPKVTLPNELAGLGAPPWIAILLQLLGPKLVLIIPTILADLQAGKSWNQITMDLLTILFTAQARGISPSALLAEMFPQGSLEMAA